MDERPICPATVPDEAPAPLADIAILIGVLGGGLVALIAAGVVIAGGIGAILDLLS